MEKCRMQITLDLSNNIRRMWSIWKNNIKKERF